MAESPTSSEKPSRKHRRGLTRIAAACERCRRRKQKCDSKVPICGPCEVAGTTCVISDRLTVQNSSEDETASLRAEIDYLRYDNERLNNELSAEKQKAIVDSALSGGPRRSLERPQHSATEPPEQSDRESTIHATYSGRILRPTFVAGHSHRGIDSDILGSTWHLWNNDASKETPNQEPSSLDDIPMSRYGEDLISVYFNNHWAHLPVLHRPTFLAQHYEPVSREASARPYSMFQVYIVFAIAACGARVRSVNSYSLSHREFFQRAVDYLSAVVAADDLDYIQCLLLLCQYGRNEPQSVNMWHTTGMALRTAIGLDLHRQESVVKYGLYEAEMAKRIFWGTYVLDRSMALALGRPLGIRDDDITIPLPLQYTDQQLAMAASDVVTPNMIPETTDTSTFIHVIKIRRIGANIYTVFHSAGKSNSLEDMNSLRLQYSRELTEWLVTAPRYFTTTSMFQSPEWFQIAYHHATLSLHRPSYAVPVPSADSLRVCADSAISLISSYASLYARNKVSYSFIALNSIFMAAVTMLYSLRASPFIRQELSKEVMETNLASCLSLFRGISNGREIANKCSSIVSRLGNVTLALFDGPSVMDEQVDTEFLAWFGLKSQRGHLAAVLSNGQVADSTLQNEPLPDYPSVASIDVPWHDFFAEGFDWEAAVAMDFPGMETQ